jgi:parallel beta-helix repeat protein
MVRIAKISNVFMLSLLILIYAISMSNAYPHLTPINGIEWENVTGTNEAYRDVATNQEWITFKKEISSGNWNSSIENDVDGMTYFKWRSDKKIGEIRFRSIKFYNNNNMAELLSFDSKNNVSYWKQKAPFNYNGQNKYILNFIYNDMKGTIWVAFPPQDQMAPNPTKEMIRLDKLEYLTCQPIDLGGRRFLVQDDDEDDSSRTLIINAYNFSIEPFKERNIIRDIVFNKTSSVEVSKFIFRGEIVLEESKDCRVEQNIISVSDGYGLYIGNNSSNNSISENIIKSDSIHNDDPVIYFYRSDSNNLTNNDIDNSPNVNVHYYLDESYGNVLTIYPGTLFINDGYYQLNDSCIFGKIIDPTKAQILTQDNKTAYLTISANFWKCGL